MPAVVTISASFGAGGSIVGPQVAQRLGLPFLDRAIPAAAARRLQVPDSVAAALDEHAPSMLERLARALAHASAPIGPDPIDMVGDDDPDEFRHATEAVLRQVADTTGAVVLGRCAMVVLAGRPDVLSVRLDGPVEARVASVAARETMDIDEIRRAQRESDRTREAYARVFYRVSQDDPTLYHLMIDATAIDLDSCVELVVTAASARFGLRDGSREV